MKKTKESSGTTSEMRQEDAYPDEAGFIQNYPDDRGFAPGKQPEKADGKWRSSYPDENGWYSSSTE